MKPGIKTTEFWITLVGMFAPLIFGLVPAEYQGLVIAVLAGLYTIARAVVKMSASKMDDEILEKVKTEILTKLGVKGDQ